LLRRRNTPKKSQVENGGRERPHPAKNKLIQSDNDISRRLSGAAGKSPEIRRFRPCRCGNGMVTAVYFRAFATPKTRARGTFPRALTPGAANGTAQALVTP
jgi:hypothetical protein